MKNKYESNNSVFLLFLLWKNFSNKRKKQLAILLLLMILSGFADAFSLASIMPFLGVIINPSKISSLPLIGKLPDSFNIHSSNNLIIIFTLIFTSATLIAAALRVLNIFISNRLSAVIGTDLSCEAYRRTLFQDYESYLKRSSNEIIAAATSITANVVISIYSALQIFTSGFIFIALLTTLLYINWAIAFITAMLICLVYLILAINLKTRLSSNSSFIVKYTNNQVKALQEGLGGFREVYLNNHQVWYLKIYELADKQLRLKISENAFLNLFPKYVLEAFGMLILAFITLFLTKNSSENDAIIPTIGAFALGAQRILPTTQLIYSSWTNIQSRNESMRKILQMIRQPINGSKNNLRIKSLPFKNSINLENVSFKYKGSENIILDNVNLAINKGEKVGFYGKTGSGKSTLIDLIMGLLLPTKGEIKIDGIRVSKSSDFSKNKSWQSNISHVPQSIFLVDATIAENIAFGIPYQKIDFELVEKVAEIAQLHDLILKSKNGYFTLVGERGVRLSGGQRQRIGIARGLYKRSNVLILDEATSALDLITEQKVMRGIFNLDSEITLLIIAHRLSTLDNCDKMVEIAKGKINIK